MREIVPLGDFVLVRPRDDTGGVSQGGIFLPDGAGGLGDLVCGRIVSVGPLNPKTKDETNIAVEPGNNVLFSKHAGLKLKIEGDDFILVAIGMLIAKIS